MTVASKTPWEQLREQAFAPRDTDVWDERWGEYRDMTAPAAEAGKPGSQIYRAWMRRRAGQKAPT